ncbi:MAG TPA: GntR family transcriptional regulator [Acidimicrobiia bacterium]|nr:GntR family transcriptional regulator [Acidimicrobiia bacterium]
MPDIAGEKQLSLVEHALTSMRERILSGEYPPGSRLRLHVLAQETGASLIPVREALRVLETERLIETIPNRGARVVPLSITDMNDLYAVRILLEAEAVRAAVPIDGKTEKELLRILSKMKVAVKENETKEIIRLNQEFHFGIYRRSNSQWLLYLIDLLWNHTERYQRLSLSFRHDAADREHRAILKALAAGQSEEAAIAMRDHLRTTATLVAEYFKKTEA